MDMLVLLAVCCRAGGRRRCGGVGVESAQHHMMRKDEGMREVDRWGMKGIERWGRGCLHTQEAWMAYHGVYMESTDFWGFFSICSRIRDAGLLSTVYCADDTRPLLQAQIQFLFTFESRGAHNRC